jgi:hypothetical protein
MSKLQVHFTRSKRKSAIPSQKIILSVQKINQKHLRFLLKKNHKTKNLNNLETKYNYQMQCLQMQLNII